MALVRVGKCPPVFACREELIEHNAAPLEFVNGQQQCHAAAERIAAAAGLHEPNGEGMQILRYENGQKYDPHYDYFHDQVNSAPRRGGQRMATMLIYLEDTEQGGETIFPNGERPEHWDADEPGNNNEWSECAKKGIPVK